MEKYQCPYCGGSYKIDHKKQEFDVCCLEMKENLENSGLKTKFPAERFDDKGLKVKK